MITELALIVPSQWVERVEEDGQRGINEIQCAENISMITAMETILIQCVGRQYTIVLSWRNSQSCRKTHPVGLFYVTRKNTIAMITIIIVEIYEDKSQKN